MLYLYEIVLITYYYHINKLLNYARRIDKKKWLITKACALILQIQLVNFRMNYNYLEIGQYLNTTVFLKHEIQQEYVIPFHAFRNLTRFISLTI